MKSPKNNALKLSVIAVMVGIVLIFTFADSKTNADSAYRVNHPATAAAQASPHSGTSSDSPGATDNATQQQTTQKPSSLFNMSQEEADRRSAGCNDCHTGIEDMHGGKITIGCTDCHGGNAESRLPQGAAVGSAPYEEAKKSAHVPPRYPQYWKSSANPVRPYALTLKESPEFIRFVNPGDLRVAELSCGSSGCHTGDVHNVRKSMMTTGAMLWGAALYNNGAFPLKNYRFGESYDREGNPQRVITYPQPTIEETMKKGILPYLDPLPRWEITQMGNILRTFERGGRKAAEIGNPLIEELPGKPTQNLLSFRGLGTLLRTDPVFLGLQKTRLLDPLLSLYGTNDHPGDYRSSGCTACHVVYANDSNPFHAGPFAKFGHMGLSQTADKTIPKNESGHPVKHQFTRAIPSSNCVVCHMHPGTLVLNSYFGYTWWDLETDGGDMYDPKKLSPEEEAAALTRNPEESVLRGKWRDPKFLENLNELNKTRKHTQFADFAGHGWIFRSAFKKDRKGNLLDVDGNVIENVTNEALQRAVKETTDDPASRKGVPVHLKDIHLEKGMHCVDCHFKQDNHGNGKLYGEVRNAIEIDCKDCHGTISERADPTSSKWLTSAAAGGNRMLDYRNLPSGKDRFFRRDGKLFQRAAVAVDERGKPKEWEVKQVADSINPASPNYNEKAALAKTIMRDNKTWGGVPADPSKLAHANDRMTCYACHTAWTPSCFGCHLKMEANEKRPMLHNEGEPALRNWTSYNFQTLRDDVFLLGKDGTVTGRRFAPVRSACAVYVSSQNALREWLYSQQQTVSQEGYSGQAFSSHFPHTVRTKETRGCDDCHLSEKNDNNAHLAMTYMQGTNFYNWIGRYAYVALGEAGLAGVVVTERNEPQAVIGSYLHKIAYPEEYKKHTDVHHKELHEFYEHPGNDVSTNFKPFVRSKSNIRSLQLRGEYLYAACGEAGFKFFDVANIDQKGFSERITTAPFSPLGQKFYVKSKNATAIASPATIAVDPTRATRPENEERKYRDDKQDIPLVYAFLYGTDSEEGLVVLGNPKAGKNNIGVATLLDGDPNNNFIERAATFNPNNVLKGANNIVVAGTFAYITCDRGLVIVDLNNPLQPKLVTEIGEPFVKKPRAVQVQFRYAFVADAEGIKVIDVTDPTKAKAVSRAVVSLEDARNLYLVRTYAYVAAGKQGLAIVDIENPEQPRLEQIYNGGGEINDAYDVKVGMTNVSLFAYIAGGKQGLQVVQLTSPEDTKGHYGFSPRPTPKLIAHHHFHIGEAYAISEGVDRDRAVDENGYQVAVFGRRGARPMNAEEMMRMYMIDGQMFRVPEIKDNDPKRNKDIRRFYGDPARQTAETVKKEEGATKSGEAIGENQSSLLRLLRMKNGRFIDALGAALLFGAVLVRFSGMRRSRRR